MITETETKVAYFDPSDVDSDTGKPKVKITSEDAFNKKVAKATTDKEPLPEMKATGSFVFNYATTVDEAVTLAGGQGVGEYENFEVFLGVFNYGAALRQHNVANDLLKSESYVPQDGAVDMAYAVAEKVERAKQSPEEKASKMLGISPDALRAALASIRGQQASTQIAGQ